MNSPSILSITILIMANGTTGILDGERAMDNQFIYQVAILTTYKSHVCSGGIIDKTHLLTAAHCVHNKEAWELLVGAGKVELKNPDMMLRNVIEIWAPEEYIDGVPTPNSTTHLQWEANDIAVLTIDRAFKWNSAIGYLTLPFKNFVSCAIGKVAGWGEDELDSEYSESLQWTFQRILESDICGDEKAYHSADQFCAITPFLYGKPSDGDDGSPLVIDGVVVGIVEVVTQEDLTFTRFTNVYHYLDFITRIIVI